MLKLTLSLLVAFIFCSSAKAETFMVMQFNDDVRIVLSQSKCELAGYRAAAQKINGEFLKGCWSAKDAMIVIKWEAGDFSEFPVEAFKPTNIEML